MSVIGGRDAMSQQLFSGVTSSHAHACHVLFTSVLEIAVFNKTIRLLR